MMGEVNQVIPKLHEQFPMTVTAHVWSKRDRLQLVGYQLLSLGGFTHMGFRAANLVVGRCKLRVRKHRGYGNLFLIGQVASHQLSGLVMVPVDHIAIVNEDKRFPADGDMRPLPEVQPEFPHGLLHQAWRNGDVIIKHGRRRAKADGRSEVSIGNNHDVTATGLHCFTLVVTLQTVAATRSVYNLSQLFILSRTAFFFTLAIGIPRASHHLPGLRLRSLRTMRYADQNDTNPPT